MRTYIAVILIIAYAVTCGLFGASGIIYGSDVTGANHEATIEISNNGTAATGVSVNLSLDTDSYVAAALMDALAAYVAILQTDGEDAAFMPGANSTLPWMIFVPEIGNLSTIFNTLYCNDATGGKYCYFPGYTGMLTLDSPSLEFRDDFSYEAKGYLDTSVTDNICVKPEAFNILSNSGDNITAQIYGTSVNITGGGNSVLIYADADATLEYNDGNYNTAWSATTAEHVFTTSDLGQYNPYYGINRVAMIFNTDEYIPDGADIVSTWLGFYCTGDNSETDVDIVIQTGNNTYPSLMPIASDYNKDYYSGDGGSINTISIVEDSYNFILLNTDGLGWINDDDYTRFMLRSSNDIAGTYTNPIYNEWIHIAGQATAGTEYDPFLYVVYNNVEDGEKTVNLTAHGGEYSTEAEFAPTLHFNGDTDSNVNFGGIHDSAGNLTIWFDFCPDATYNSTITTRQYLFGKNVDASNYLQLFLSQNDGSLVFRTHDAVDSAVLETSQASWTANTTYRVLFSINDTSGHYLIVDNGTPLTDATTVAAPSAGNLVFGDYTDPGIGTGFHGTISNIFVCTDSLTSGEITNIFSGIPPGDEVNFWPLDEGSGVTAYDRAGSNNGTIDTSGEWCTSHRYVDMYLEVDGVKWGTNLHGSSVPDTAYAINSFHGYVMPYVEYQSISINDTQQQYIEWAYGGSPFTDQSGNSHDAYPSFRTTSSDADVSAAIISFQPTEEATAGDVSENFTGNIITEAPDEPDTMYSENTTPGFFMGGFINTILQLPPGTDYDIPPFFFWSTACFVLIIGLGILVFAVSKSLLLKAIIMFTLMLVFSLPGLNIYGVWAAIYFAFFALGDLFLSKHYGW